jgi:hypothetical protein
MPPADDHRNRRFTGIVWSIATARHAGLMRS